jgi:nitroreductase
MGRVMNVSEAVERRTSVRAFLPTPIPAAIVEELLERAARAPSGGNLQPWQVYALSGAPLAKLKQETLLNPGGESPEYQVYPPNLWDPLRTRRFQTGEDLYATLGIPREDRDARLRQLAKNGQFFGAPVGLFFCMDRRVGPPQWSDVGMFMQTLMLLATERGIDSCAQEYWSRYPKTAARHLNLPEEMMIFAGMALGYRDPNHPINGVRTQRDPLPIWAELRGFEGTPGGQ